MDRTKEQLIGELAEMRQRIAELEEGEAQRKRAEEALRDSEEMWRGMAQSAAIGTYLVQGGKFQYVSPRVEEICGYTSDELVGTDPLAYIHPEDREATREAAIANLKGHSRTPYEFRFIRKDGEPVWILESVASIEYGGERGTIATFMDITERKQAEREMAGYSRELEALNAIAATLSQTLNIQELLDSILDKVLEVMEIETGGIFMLDEHSHELFLRAHRGLSAEAAQGVGGMRIGEGLIGQVAQSGKPLLVENVSEDPRLSRMVMKKEGHQSFAAVPIMSKGRVLGVLPVASHGYREFSGEEVRLLETIAGQLGTAIENAQLYEGTLELAFTDSLTGLYNRRYLTDQIDREYARAQRLKAPLSLIMIDLDGLKAINDRIGHHAGDAALRELGRVLKDNARASDIAARWGGDEFMILAPEADSSGARVIAERIVSKVEECRVQIDGEEVRITISVGIASYPADASDASQLLQRVDEAMYKAKRTGKISSIWLPNHKQD